MDLIQFLKSLLTVSFISKIIERHKAPKSIVFDEVFTNRTTTPTPELSMADLERKTGNVAVTARGAAALPVGGARAAITKIEPMPIRLKESITGADLNDLRKLYGTGDEKGQQLVAAWVEKKLQSLMSITDNTRNALCAQALTGKIDYMMQSDGGYERYQVEFGDGNTLKVTPAKLFSAADASIGLVLKTLRAMQNKLAQSGSAGAVKFLAGQNAFDALVDLITRLPNDQRIGATVQDNAIVIGGKKIILDDITYNDRNASGAAVVKSEIDDDSIVAIAADQPELTYCAIDDIDGNLEAIPFFNKIVKKDDPSGIDLISESKPMPLVSSKGFCWAKVV